MPGQILCSFPRTPGDPVPAYPHARLASKDEPRGLEVPSRGAWYDDFQNRMINRGLDPRFPSAAKRGQHAPTRRFLPGLGTGAVASHGRVGTLYDVAATDGLGQARRSGDRDLSVGPPVRAPAV